MDDQRSSLLIMIEDDLNMHGQLPVRCVFDNFNCMGIPEVFFFFSSLLVIACLSKIASSSAAVPFSKIYSPPSFLKSQALIKFTANKFYPC